MNNNIWYLSAALLYPEARRDIVASSKSISLYVCTVSSVQSLVITNNRYFK